MFNHEYVPRTLFIPAYFKGEGGFLPEVQLMTLRELDPFVKFRIGGLVVSRSVKYLGKKKRTRQLSV